MVALLGRVSQAHRQTTLRDRRGRDCEDEGEASGRGFHLKGMRHVTQCGSAERKQRNHEDMRTCMNWLQDCRGL